MLAKRIIARLDIKGPNVVKGVRMEGLRIMGDPITLAKKYADGHLRVVTPLAAERVSSKELRERLHTFLHGKTLIVASGGNRSLYLSARNLSRVGVVRADTLQVGDLLRHRRVLVEAGALNEIPA